MKIDFYYFFLAFIKIQFIKFKLKNIKNWLIIKIKK